MLRYRLLKIVTITIILGVLITAGYNYISRSLSTEYFLTKIDKTLMTDDEYEIFKEIRELIKKKKITEVNEIIKIEKDDISVKFTLNKEVYKKNENIDIDLVVLNKSDKNLVLFPLILEELSEPCLKEGLIIQQVAIDPDVVRAKFIKVLRPQSSYSKSFKIKALSLGPNQIKVDLGVPIIKEIEKGKIALSNIPIKRDKVHYIVE